MSVRLIQDATALMSMRNSDFDAYSAYGEVVDNSIQADAKNIKIRLSHSANSDRKNAYAVVDEIAFGDDGQGMSPEILQRCMQLGYSTRYNDRSGIGRFGVGMTLAAINQCVHIEIFSKERGKDWFWTYVDLKDIASTPPKMEGIPEPIIKELPMKFQTLVGKDSGTLVVWGNYDRQPCSAHELLDEMKIWFGRTYRVFLWAGTNIEVNGESVKPIDPLYVRTEGTAFPDDPPAHEYAPMNFKWPVPDIDRPNGIIVEEESEITIRMSLLPEALRPYKGFGNSRDATSRHVDRNEGVSILRNGREVFHGHLPHWPGEKFVEIDRYWGCEISFDAILDRAFTVKNIKRGATPVPELRKLLYDRITPTRNSALDKVRDHWKKGIHDERQKQIQGESEEIRTGHEEAEHTAAATATDKSEIDKDKNKEDEARILVDTVRKDESDQTKAAWIVKFSSQPYTIMDDRWRGPAFFETNHMGGADVIRYNCTHPFIETLNEIIDEIKALDITDPRAKDLKCLIDILLISYSKAEAKFGSGQLWTAEQFIEQLRNNWGFYLSSYLRTWIEEKE